MLRLICTALMMSLTCAMAKEPDVARGKQLVRLNGCHGCHTIPQINDASGNIGPPLNGIGSRAYLSGVRSNSTDMLMEWIRFPQKIVPGNAMPDMGVSEEDARDIAAFLDSLK